MAVGDKFFAVMKNELAVSNGVATLGPDGLLNASQRPITDSMPTQGSSNPVQSGGVYSALSNKVSHTADYVPAMQDLHGDARGLVCTVPAAAGPEIASINAPPGVEWGTCLSLQVGDIRTLMLIDTSGLWIQYGTTSGWTAWVKNATATPPQDFDLPLAEGISAVNPCTYRKNQFSEVSVGGSVSGPIEAGTAIATLPSGFRPTNNVERPAVYSVNGAWTGGTVAITTDGIVRAYGQASATSVVFAADFVAAD